MTDDVKSWARNAVTDLSYKWPNGEVPYYIAKDFDEYEKSVILGAIDTFHDKTCIRFRPYKKGDRSWVSIQGDAPGCWSYVGRRGGGQVVNLGYRCVQHGVAAHELLHALGFYHQQSASDRDVYVTINWQNIRKGTERNFKKYSHRRVTDYGIGYDYSSVMHYSGYAFSKNGKPTIIPKDLTATIGQRARVSKKDLDKVNIMYSCSARYFSRVVNPFVSFWNFNYR
ncbi:hypothetical protein AAG570_000591 [Ranatra chinensis]|uniref:Metalloendopeptidase n=1 Tax=Ranatra chinensis TaxID=642074 RepID=A0ABD0YY80_9HEMI